MLHGLAHTRQQDQDEVHHHVFENKQMQCHVIWVSADTPSQDFDLKSLSHDPSANNVKVFDILGKQLTPAPTTIQLSTYPVYIQIRKR